MKKTYKLIGIINPSMLVFRDEKTGVAWIDDEITGLHYTVHPNIHGKGSVIGMKASGAWKKHDKIARVNGFIYNISNFICDNDNPFEMLIANNCMCEGCRTRRSITA